MTHSNCSDTGDKRLTFVQRKALLLLSLDFSDSTLVLQRVADETCNLAVLTLHDQVVLCTSPLTTEVCCCLRHSCLKDSRGWRHSSSSERECQGGLWGCYHRGTVPREPCGTLLMAKSNRADRLKQSYLGIISQHCSFDEFFDVELQPQISVANV